MMELELSVAPQFISFEEALEMTAHERRHLLLGNGFSIGAYKGFLYQSLLDVAVGLDPSIGVLFRQLGASDFEDAMKRVIEPNDRDRLRTTFIRAVTATHPKRGEIKYEARLAAAKFLELFIGTQKSEHRGIIFTTNYDLILYWLLVEHKDILDCWDGFDMDSVWTPQYVPTTRVFYLHGGLHITERELPRALQIRKLMADQGPLGRSLIVRVRDQMTSGYFPVFISEGSHLQKRGRMRQNDYLWASLKSLTKVCNEYSNTLFTVGHGLGKVDKHLTDLIGEGKIGSVFLGIFDSADENRARERAAEWQEQRTVADGPPLKVYMFKSSECPIWKL